MPARMCGCTVGESPEALLRRGEAAVTELLMSAQPEVRVPAVTPSEIDCCVTYDLMLSAHLEVR